MDECREDLKGLDGKTGDCCAGIERRSWSEGFCGVRKRMSLWNYVIMRYGK